MRTEWKTTDDPWWWAWMLLAVVITSELYLLHLWLTHEPFAASLVLPVGVALNIVRDVRHRLRLTDIGVEVRRLQTRVYRWSDIASVERAPEW